MALLNGFKETETEQQYRRGEIYYINNASKEHVGSEMKKDRPAVIVSCDANSRLRCLWRESTTSSVRHQRRKWSRLTLHS